MVERPDAATWVVDLLWIRSGVGLTPLVVVLDESGGRVRAWQSARVARHDLARDAVELAHHDWLRSDRAEQPIVVVSSQRLRGCPDIDDVGASVGIAEPAHRAATVDRFERWLRSAIDTRSGSLVGHDDVEWALLEAVEAFNHLLGRLSDRSRAVQSGSKD